MSTNDVHIWFSIFLFCRVSLSSFSIPPHFEFIVPFLSILSILFKSHSCSTNFKSFFPLYWATHDHEFCCKPYFNFHGRQWATPTTPTPTLMVTTTTTTTICVFIRFRRFYQSLLYCKLVYNYHTDIEIAKNRNIIFSAVIVLCADTKKYTHTHTHGTILWWFGEFISFITLILCVSFSWAWPFNLVWRRSR